MKISWDFMILALTIIFTAVLVPFTESFRYLSSTIDYCDYATNVMYVIDILMTFFTSVEQDGVLVADFKKIKEMYLKRWFLFDVISSFPYNLLRSKMEKQVSSSVCVLSF